MDHITEGAEGVAHTALLPSTRAQTEDGESIPASRIVAKDQRLIALKHRGGKRTPAEVGCFGTEHRRADLLDLPAATGLLAQQPRQRGRVQMRYGQRPPARRLGPEQVVAPGGSRGMRDVCECSVRVTRVSIEKNSDTQERGSPGTGIRRSGEASSMVRSGASGSVWMSRWGRSCTGLRAEPWDSAQPGAGTVV